MNISQTASSAGLPGASALDSADPKLKRRLANVKNIILVLSGKGGVGECTICLLLTQNCTYEWNRRLAGKSSVSAQLALSLSSPSASRPTQAKVALLDVDLTGPSIPRMVGLDGQSIRQSQDGWVPVYADASQSLAVMSVGFLLKSKNDSVVWRGPKKNAMIRQFLGDVRWGDLDYLIIDTPPGTSDEHISIMELLHPFKPKAVLVTTPQAISLADNLRSLDFCRKTNLPLIGLIENMSGYVCPHCAECTNVWGKGGGEALANREGIAFLGRIPIDPKLVRLLDDAKEVVGDEAEVALPLEEGPATTAATDSTTPAGTRLSRTILERYKESDTFPIFQSITQTIVESLAS
jgi:Mrp family chromosome partitioning ATPase